MHRFKIIPVDAPIASAEIVAQDAGSALNIASQLRCSEVDVLRNGAYHFSLRKQGGDGGYWAIFHKREAEGGAGAEEQQLVQGQRA